MAATINNFLSAVITPSDYLRTLCDAFVLRDGTGEIATNRTTFFTDAIIEWQSKRYILSLPLNKEALRMAEYAAVTLRSLSSPILLEYKVLKSEMMYIDAQGRVCSADLILQELPKGEFLSEIAPRDAEELFAAIDELERELKRLKLVYSNLKAENIVVAEDNKLYALRPHYINQKSQHADDFNALREFVANLCGVEYLELSTDRGGDGIDYPCKTALYGYTNVGNPFEGLCVAENENGYGYIAPDGSEVIAPQYLWASDIREGRAEVETEQGMGLIDAKGNYIIEPNNQIVEFDIETGISRVKRDDKWSRFDYNGVEIVE